MSNLKLLFGAAILLSMSCSKKGGIASPTPVDSIPLIDSILTIDTFWTGRIYRYDFWPPMYPGLRRTNELQFINESQFIQRGVDYEGSDSFVDIRYHSFTFDTTTNYLFITSGNTPPTLSSTLLKYAGDSIIRISFSNHLRDTVELDIPYIRIQ